MESVRNFASRKPLVLPKDTPIEVIARAMGERGLGAAVLTDKERGIVGLVTARDLACEALAHRLDPGSPGAQIMTPGPSCVAEDTPLSEAIEVMKGEGVWRLPVVHQSRDGKPHCVGMLGLDDLILARRLSPEDLEQCVRARIAQFRRRPARRRAERRKESKSGEFYAAFARELGEDKARARRILLLLLDRALRRVTYAEALDLLSQLPERVQDEFVDLTPGPQPSITAASLVGALREQEGLDEASARALLPKAWRALAKAMGQDERMATGEGELAEVASQFPAELAGLLGAVPHRRKHGRETGRPRPAPAEGAPKPAAKRPSRLLEV